MAIGGIELEDDFDDDEPTDCDLRVLEADDDEAEEESFTFAKDEQELKTSAQTWLTKFFANKKSYFGGTIPKALLLREENIEMLLSWELTDAISYAYSLIENSQKLPRVRASKNRGPADIQLVLDLLRECEQMRMPQYFAAGTLLVYLKLCHGISQAKSVNLSAYDE